MRSMKEPTSRQKEVLSFITGYIRTHVYPPTIREIAEHFAISIKGAHDHVRALQKKGALRQGDGRSRTLELVECGEEFFEEGNVKIPILGTVAAGRPIFAEENQDGVIRMHQTLLKKDREYFALRVRGDSMEGAGVMDGDIAVIEQQPTVQNGEIAVVMLEDDTATLKTFYRESSRIRLQPENPRYKPIYCSKDVRVLGRLAQIIRSYD
jgi:repressor LexA